MDLAQLAQFAAGTATRTGKTPSYELAIEEARNVVKVVDGNKVKKEDEQALVLRFGRRTLPLNVIKAGATRLNIVTAQVESVTEKLLNAVQEGKFDTVIVEAQTALKEAKAKADATPKTTTEPTAEEVTEALTDVDEALPEVQEETSDVPNVDGLDLSSI